MTENLRLDNSITYESTTSEFSTDNTNNPSLPLVNDYDQQITSNRLSESSYTWCTNSAMSSCPKQSRLNTINTTQTTVSPEFTHNFTYDVHQHFDDNIFSYGNYYNWYSATAGNSEQETTSTTVNGDICPVGWKLPIGDQTNTNGSFSHLDTVMGGTGDRQMTVTAANKWRSFPNNYIYSGLWKAEESASYRGYIGYYWTSTADDDSGDEAHILSIYNNLVHPGGASNTQSAGKAVRCIIPTQ